MIQGILFFDAETGRYNFYYDNGQGEQYDYGGIHCGECFEVKLNGVWVPTRVEMGCDREWYLADLPGMKLDGVEVRQRNHEQVIIPKKWGKPQFFGIVY